MNDVKKETRRKPMTTTLLKIMQDKFNKQEINELKDLLKRYLICQTYVLSSMNWIEEIEKREVEAIAHQTRLASLLSSAARVHDDIVDLLKEWEIDNKDNKDFFKPVVPETLQ